MADFPRGGQAQSRFNGVGNDYGRGTTQQVPFDFTREFPQPPNSPAPGNRILGGDGLPLDSKNPFLIPHFETFSAIQNYYSRTYRYTYDEALRALPANALAMRRDVMLMAMLQERYLPTTELEWSLVPEDPKNPEQKAVAEELQAILKATPKWQMMMFNLSDAIWYGRYGAQIQWERDWVGGKRRWKVVDYRPVNGDKIQYSWDGYPCIYVNPFYGPGFPADKMVLTDRTMALRIDNREWRERFIVHHHQPDDADYFEGEMAGGVQGVGVRSRIYWSWWLMQELRAWAMDFMEKVGSLGLLVFYYEAGNPASQAAAMTAAVEQSRKSVVVWPRPIGTEKQGAGIELLSPSVTGIDALMKMMEDFYVAHIRRYIVGQEASTSSKTEGMGTHNTDFQADTKYRILKADADNLEQTLSTDLVKPCRRLNRMPEGFPIYFKFSVPRPENEKKMEAIKTFFDMGAAIKEEEAYEVADLTIPQAGDKIIKMQEPAAPGMPGAPGGTPGGPGQSAPDDIDAAAANGLTDEIDKNAAGPGYDDIDEAAASDADEIDKAAAGGDVNQGQAGWRYVGKGPRGASLWSNGKRIVRSNKRPGKVAATQDAKSATSEGGSQKQGVDPVDVNAATTEIDAKAAEKSIDQEAVSKHSLTEEELDAAVERFARRELGWDESEHPRGQPENAGQFTDAIDKAAAAPSPTQGAARDAVGKIKPSKRRAFAGVPTGGQEKLSKQLAGAIGEEIVIQYLKSKGFKDAQPFSTWLKSSQNNLPIDLIQDHEVIEAKTGQSSNGPGAQQWRLTIGEPGKKDQEWLKSATAEEKAAANAWKQEQIHKRKEEMIAEVSRRIGKKIKGRTMTVILNHDTKTADLYSFDGFHDRIGWNSEAAQKAYIGSVNYGSK